MNWNPSNGDEITIDYPQCNPWTVMNQNSKVEDVEWQPQITTSMPLEALYSLLKEHLQDPEKKNFLDGTNYRYFDPPIELVTQDHFQSNSNGVEKSTVGDDVLAFCTLVMSYAKPAGYRVLDPNQSPKLFTSFMPRTEFNTLYAQVQSKLPGDLFQLSESLACYTTDEDLNTM